jgi:hypothetical protein
VDEDVRFIGLLSVTGELLLAVALVGGVHGRLVVFTTTFVVAVATQVPAVEVTLTV